MPLDIWCPLCGEDDDLAGVRSNGDVTISSHGCGQIWTRWLVPRCPNCDGTDLETVLLAIVERSRGTHLSLEGTRMVQLGRGARPEADRDAASQPAQPAVARRAAQPGPGGATRPVNPAEPR